MFLGNVNSHNNNQDLKIEIDRDDELLKVISKFTPLKCRKLMMIFFIGNGLFAVVSQNCVLH